MSTTQCGKYNLHSLQKINILLGKNGCGKSSALKEIVKELRKINRLGLAKYITPERGGILKYEPNVDSNMLNQAWYNQTREKNQFTQFKEQTFVTFKDLKNTVLTSLENYISEQHKNGITNFPPKDLEEKFFQTTISKINQLLDNIELRNEKSTYELYSKSTKEKIKPEDISSGESELITLGIECLAFFHECKIENINYLVLDEPDVHIHPDLQAKLMHFLKELVETGKFIVLIATHSTALLGALEDYEHVGFHFMSAGQNDFTFKKVNREYKDILPIFGAHPLSNIYSKTPIFLLEGDDDVWIWQIAIRKSKKLKIFPCSTDGIDNMLKYEVKVNEILDTVYDPGSIAYSLRDKDDTITDNKIADFEKLKYLTRFMLSCRCSENLFLTDEVITHCGSNWEDLKSKIDDWTENNKNHSKYKYMKEFKDGNYDRKNFKNIKKIIQIIVGLIATKPWQFLVGQQIGNLANKNHEDNHNHQKNTNGLADYLGNDLINTLFVSNEGK